MRLSIIFVLSLLSFFLIGSYTAKPIYAATCRVNTLEPVPQGYTINVGTDGVDTSFPTQLALNPTSGSGTTFTLGPIKVSSVARPEAADYSLPSGIPVGTYKAVVVVGNFFIACDGGTDGSGTVDVTSALWNLYDPTISGKNVTFTWDKAANANMVLIIIDFDDPAKTAVWDSGAEGVSIDGKKTVTMSTDNWNVGPGIPIDGWFEASLVGNAYALKSNKVKFNMDGGGKSWKDPGTPPGPFNILDVFQPAKRFGSFGQLASDILLILVGIAAALALIFIVISGIKLATSSGDEKKLASARATLTYAIIGIAVVILAFAIVRILQYFLQSNIPIT